MLYYSLLVAGGKTVDASQEMVALGICNLLGSFVQSMPTTGSFSRTAVNSSSGVKTPMGGIYTGALVILCLAFLMPYCAFIPKASLSAVIMTAVIFSVEYEVVLPIWSSKSNLCISYRFILILNCKNLICCPGLSASLLDSSLSSTTESLPELVCTWPSCCTRSPDRRWWWR